MFADRIRLNVGQVEVLTLSSDKIQVLCDASFKIKTNKRLWFDSKRSNRFYPAVPIASRRLRLAPVDLGAVPGSLWNVHESFIDAAAEAKRVSPFKTSFSDGVLKHIEILLDSVLPRPSYLVAQDETSMANGWRSGEHSAIQGMSAYLLVWNPKVWPWRRRKEDLKKFVKNGTLRFSWSCGNRRILPAGSRVFMLKLGEAPKGIIGSGSTVSKPYLDQDRYFIDFEFDALSESPVLSLNELQRLSSFHWRVQGSDIEIPDETTMELEKAWTKKKGMPVRPFIVETDRSSRANDGQGE